MALMDSGARPVRKFVMAQDFIWNDWPLKTCALCLAAAIPPRRSGISALDGDPAAVLET